MRLAYLGSNSDGQEVQGKKRDAGGKTLLRKTASERVTLDDQLIVSFKKQGRKYRNAFKPKCTQNELHQIIKKLITLICFAKTGFRFLCGRNAFRNDVEQRAGAGDDFGKLVHEKYNLSASTTIYRMDCSNTTTNL